MAFEFNQTNLTNQKKAEVCQFSTTSKFSVTDDAQVKKILKVVATPKINSHEQVADGVNFAGTTYVNIAYISTDDELLSINGQFDWQNKCDSLELSQTLYLPKIADLECHISDDCVNLSCLISVSEIGLEQVAIKNLVADETLVTKKETKTVKTVVASNNEEFNIVEDFSVQSGIEEILATKADVAVKNVYSGVDSVTIEGLCFVDALIKTADGIGEINKAFDFKQEVSCLGATVGQIANAYIQVYNASMLISETEGDENNSNASLTVGVVCQVTTQSESEIEIVCDAFSCVADTIVSTTCEEFNVYGENVLVSDNAVLNIALDNYPEFDEIKSVLVTNTNISEIRVVDDKTQIEGVIDADVIYSIANGGLDKKEAVLPFVLQVSGEFTDIEKIVAQVSSFKIRGAHELEVIVSLTASPCKLEKTFINFISSIEISEEQLQEDAGIKMYVAKENEDLFDVSRVLKVRPEQILAQNDNIESINAGDKIFVYLPQTANF